jgi:hypothetical protein
MLRTPRRWRRPLTNFGPAVARPLWPVSAAPNPIMIPLDLAGLRRGLARDVKLRLVLDPGTGRVASVTIVSV